MDSSNAFNDNLYNAIAHAETGHLNDPYIRTEAKGTGSSAYGPVQINKAALTGPGYADIGFTPEENDWVQNTYLPQMNLFLKYGGSDMVPGMERYDYGGRGDFTPEDRQKYDNMSKKLMKFEYDRTMKGGGSLDDFIHAWRGAKENEDILYPEGHARAGQVKIKADPRYYKEVRDKYLVDNVTTEAF